jgi:hypothetical protein
MVHVSASRCVLPDRVQREKVVVSDAVGSDVVELFSEDSVVMSVDVVALGV